MCVRREEGGDAEMQSALREKVGGWMEADSVCGAGVGLECP